MSELEFLLYCRSCSFIWFKFEAKLKPICPVLVEAFWTLWKVDIHVYYYNHKIHDVDMLIALLFYLTRAEVHSKSSE